MTAERRSIYAFTRTKLAGHSNGDSAVMNDKGVLVLFVLLERARRAGDFESVVQAVERIEAYFIETGQRYRVIYAYMYLLLSAGSRRTAASSMDGWYEATYRDEARYRSHRILTDIWAQHQYERFAKHFLPLCYKNRDVD